MKGRYQMNQITVPARKENLSRVLEFIGRKLEPFPYNATALLRLELSVEEAFVNIASYAYQLNKEKITQQEEIIPQEEITNHEKITVQEEITAPEETADEEITVRLIIYEDPLQIMVQLIDSGTRFNPLGKEDPDVSKGIEEKEPGGLGIFLIKKNVDQAQYEYQNGKNILTLHKRMD
jgi:anti-sigma regulatory factor (Ser/Thr protein kinase)